MIYYLFASLCCNETSESEIITAKVQEIRKMYQRSLRNDHFTDDDTKYVPRLQSTPYDDLVSDLSRRFYDEPELVESALKGVEQLGQKINIIDIPKLIRELLSASRLDTVENIVNRIFVQIQTHQNLTEDNIVIMIRNKGNTL